MKKKILLGNMLATLLLISMPLVSSLQSQPIDPAIESKDTQTIKKSISIQLPTEEKIMAMSGEELVTEANKAVVLLSQDSRFADIQYVIENEVMPFIEEESQQDWTRGECRILAAYIVAYTIVVAFMCPLCKETGLATYCTPCAVFSGVLTGMLFTWARECGHQSDPTQTTIDSAIKGSIAELNNAIEVTNAVVVNDDCGCGQIQSTPLHSNIIK